MGDRKELQRYSDPNKEISHPSQRGNEPREKKWRRWGQKTITISLPMTIRCLECGNFLYVNTKYNSRKEPVIGENYVGVPIYRFYIKCSRCLAEITFKTDPKNARYVVEYGGAQQVDHVEAHLKAIEESIKQEQEKQEVTEVGRVETNVEDSKGKTKGVEELRKLTRFAKMLDAPPDDLVAFHTLSEGRKQEGDTKTTEHIGHEEVGDGEVSSIKEQDDVSGGKSTTDTIDNKSDTSDAQDSTSDVEEESISDNLSNEEEAEVKPNDPKKPPKHLELNTQRPTIQADPSDRRDTTQTSTLTGYPATSTTETSTHHSQKANPPPAPPPRRFGFAKLLGQKR